MTTPGEMPVTAIREWARAEWRKAPGLGPARLETVRVLREQCYMALQVAPASELDTSINIAARAILDTPVAELAAMVVMSDTVMGNWRTIAATVTA